MINITEEEFLMLVMASRKPAENEDVRFIELFRAHIKPDSVRLVEKSLDAWITKNITWLSKYIHAKDVDDDADVRFTIMGYTWFARLIDEYYPVVRDLYEAILHDTHHF